MSDEKPQKRIPTAYEKACWLLGMRDYTAKGMLKKLCEKYPNDEAEKAVIRCVRLGAIDDKRYGEILCRRYAEKYGKKRIVSQLIAKGIGTDLAKELVASYYEESDEDESAAKIYKILCDYLHRKPLTENTREKAFAYMMRKGYGYREISEAFNTFKENNPESFPEQDYI